MSAVRAPVARVPAGARWGGAVDPWPNGLLDGDPSLPDDEVRGRMLQTGWKSYAPAAVGAAFTASATILSAVLSADNLDKFQQKAGNEAARSGSPFLATITDHRTLVIGVLVLVATAPTILSAFRTKRANINARLEIIKRFLRLAQKRTFPVTDGITSRARVSLFVPRRQGKRRELHCVYRTDGGTTRAWKVNDSKGLVVRVWREQTTRTVEELKKDDPADLARYMAESWSDESLMKSLSWPGAAMIAVPIILRAGADPDAVFVVETIGTKIAGAHHEWDGMMCSMLLEDS